MTMEMENSIALFSLIMMRMTGCIFMNPLFGRRDISSTVKYGIIMVLTILIYSVTGTVNIQMDNAVGYVILLLKELAFGYVLGAVFNFFISGILYAGSVIDYQMGMSMATIYDSQSNSSVSVSASLLNIVFMLCFLTLDAHLVILRIFITSADIVPFGEVSLGPEVATAVLNMFIQFISLILRLAMPMMAVEFFVEIGVGILMKTIPQINIFVINVQMKILVGLIVFAILFFPMADFLKEIIDVLIQSMSDAIVVMAG